MQNPKAGGILILIEEDTISIPLGCRFVYDSGE